MGRFNLITTFLLNTAGFEKGIDKATKGAKSMADGIKTAGSTMTEALSPLAGAVGDMGGEFTSMAFGAISAFKKMIPAINGVKAAIVATGIGAIIIVITTAIAGMIAWMKRTDEGADALRKAFDIVKAVIQVILSKLASLGSAIVKLFKGDFKGAAEDAKTAFTGWGEAIKDNIEAAKKLNEVQDDLEDYNETFALKRAKIEERISELQAKARDAETFNATERLDFTNQLKKANEELYNLNVGQKRLELDALKKEIELGTDNQDNRQKINDKEAELIGLRTEYNNALKETIKLNNKLAEDAELEKARQIPVAMVDTSEIINRSVIPAVKNLKKELDKTTLAGAPAGLFDENLEWSKNFNLVFEKNFKKQTSLQWLVEFRKNAKEMMDEINIAIKEGMADMISTFAEGIGTLMVTGNFKDFGKNIINSLANFMTNFGKMMIGFAIAVKALKKWAIANPGLAIAAGVGLIALAAAMKAATSKQNDNLQKMASGGIAFGNSVVNVGEYSNVRSNPEVIAPLNKLKGLLGGVNGTGGNEVVFTIKGDTLVGVLNNQSRRVNSFR